MSALPSLLDQFLEDPIALAVVGAAILAILLLALVCYLARKRIKAFGVSLWSGKAAPAATAILFLALWGYIGYIASEVEELERAEASLQRLQSDYVSKKKQAVNLDLHRQQLREIDLRYGAMLSALPARVDREFVEVMLVARGHGLTVHYLQRDDQEVAKDFYAELGGRLKVSGSFHELGAFASDAAAIRGSVLLRDLTIEPAASPGTLSLEASVTAFRYLDDEEIAAQRKAARKGVSKK